LTKKNSYNYFNETFIIKAIYTLLIMPTS